MDFSIPINWTSPFPSLGVSGALSILILFLIEFPASKQCRPWSAPCSAASDMGLHCLPRSQKSDTMLIWVKIHKATLIENIAFMKKYNRHIERSWHCSLASLLDNVPVLGVHSFDSNWQLPFLNQRKRENGRRNYFITSLLEEIVKSERHLLGKSCPLGFPFLLYLFYVVLIVCVPFPFGGCGRILNSIVSVQDHCIFIYLINLPWVVCHLGNKTKKLEW